MSDLVIDSNTIAFEDPIFAGLLSSVPPNVSPQEAISLLSEHYGISAQVKEVACERDQNFYVLTNDGREYVLKISNPEEPFVTTDFQTQGILWIDQADPSLPVPKLVSTLDGESLTKVYLSDGRECYIRVLTWLPGEPLYKVPVTQEVERSLGSMLARLGRALEGFEHPGSQVDLLWDVRHTARLWPLISALPEDEVGLTVRDELAYFETHTQGKLSTLRHQVVHNDLNHHNVMVSPQENSLITGLIDFGDMVQTYLIADVAVAASYLANHPTDPLSSVSRFVSAYHRVKPLNFDEVTVLRDLIVARLISSICITGWRATRYPSNAEYILRNNGPARRALTGFGSLDKNQVTETLLRACELE